METTVSSRPTNDTIFCASRKEYVQHTPEESVRQGTLSSLFSLGYPHSLIVVEKKLSELVAQKQKVPNRRVDILCYRATEGALEPLLLVECKANTFNDKELRQLLGYNFYLGAPYIALIAPSKVVFYDLSRQISQEYIPPFEKIT